jgi:hypothetical protein
MTLPQITPDGQGEAQIRRAFQRLNGEIVRPLSQFTIGVRLDDYTGVALTTGRKDAFVVPFDCRVVGASLVADQVGSVSVSVGRCAVEDYPPGAGDVISSGFELSSAQARSWDDMSAWTPQIEAGDALDFTVDSAATLVWVKAFLELERE